MRNLHILCGHGAPVLGKLLLKKVLWSILRYQGQSRILRQPVTPRVLLAIRSILRRWVGERDFTLIWAAVTLAFFAFLRCSEFTCRGTTSYSPGFYLSATSVSFEPNLACSQRMSVFLQWSKTDTIRKGHTLVIAYSPSTLCAVKAILNYFLLARPKGPQQIGWLTFKEGGLLTVINYTFILRKTFTGRPHLVLARITTN